MSTESKSETPRTDAELRSYHSKNWKDKSPQEMLCTFARQLEKELNEANEKLEQKDNEKDEEWLSAIAKAWNFQFGKPYETKDTIEANVCQVFQEIENLIAAHNDHVKEIEEITEAVSKFGYQDGTLVSMCERFKTYCDSQTRHLKEDTAAAVTSVKYLAKENKVMREALEIVVKDYNHPWPNEDEGTEFHRSTILALCSDCLSRSDFSNLIVLTRNELIAEIEKMPCGCKGNPIGMSLFTVKTCHRCKRIAELKGQA